MISDVFGLFLSAGQAVVTWFNSIFTATDAIGFYTGAILIILAMRFVFIPLVGRAFGSDLARSINEQKRLSRGD